MLLMAAFVTGCDEKAESAQSAPAASEAVVPTQWNIEHGTGPKQAATDFSDVSNDSNFELTVLCDPTNVDDPIGNSISVKAQYNGLLNEEANSDHKVQFGTTASISLQDGGTWDADTEVTQTRAGPLLPTPCIRNSREAILK